MSHTILLYEDDAAIANLLGEVLSDEGYQVIPCHSLPELRTLAAVTPGCLALVDSWGASYQVLSGRDRQEIADLAGQVPTIMMTGRSWTERVTPDKLGLLGLLPKPFELDALFGALKDRVAWLSATSETARERLDHPRNDHVRRA